MNQIYAITEDRRAIEALRQYVTDHLTPAFRQRDEMGHWYYCIQGWSKTEMPCLRVTDRIESTQRAEFTGSQAAFDAIVPSPTSYQVRKAI